MRKYLVAGLGQTLALGATLIPILGGQTVAVASYVLCGGIAALFTNAVLLGIPLRLPGLDSLSEARKSLRTATWITCLLLALAIVALVIVMLLPSNSSQVGAAIIRTAVGALIVLAAQCAAAIVNAWGARWHRERELSVYRLAYGIFSVLFACVFLLSGNDHWAVILGSSLALVVASTLTVLLSGVSIRTVWSHLSNFRFDDVSASARGGRVLALTTIINGIGAQAGNLLVAILPPAIAQAWAVVMRVGGGGLSIGGAVLGPFANIEFSRAKLSQDRAALTRALRKAQFAGFALGLVSPAIGIGMAFGTAELGSFDQGARAVVIAGTILFLLPQIAMSVSAQFVNIVGDLRWQSVWYALRGAAVFLILLAVPMPAAPLIAGSVIAVASIAFIAHCWQLVRRLSTGYAG